MNCSRSHTLKAFDEDLVALRGVVIETSIRAADAFEAAMLALARRDTAAAADLVAADIRIDALAADIERRGMCLLALRGPLADDLREVLGAMKIANAVERIGDYARNIARRVPRVLISRRGAAAVLLSDLGGVAADAVRSALRAYAERDAEACQRICRAEPPIHDLCGSLSSRLQAEMVTHPRQISSWIHLQFIAQHAERVADHAVEIARATHFAETGERLMRPVTRPTAAAAAL